MSAPTVPIATPPPRKEGVDLAWGDIEVRMVPGPAGWLYRRTHAGAVVPNTERLLPEVGRFPVALALRLGTGEAVVRLDPPVHLTPGEQRVLWVAWPLQVIVSDVEDGSEIEVLEPHRGRTVFGPVIGGRILSAATCAVLPDADGVEELPPEWAALRIVATNEATQAISLRRVPVNEGELSVFRRGERPAAGDVLVRILDSLRAEAHVRPGDAIEGWEVVHQGHSRQGHPRLSWWLDSTRSSVEFQL